MRLYIRSGVSAREIAKVHEKLGMAAQLLHQAISSDENYRRSPLMAPSKDKLHRMAEELRLAMFGMGERFMLLTSKDSPFANPDDPAAWLRWLDEREKTPKTKVGKAQF